MTESPKEFKDVASSNSVTTERNRLISWDSTTQGLTKPVDVIPSSKSSITLRLLRFVSKIAKLIRASLAKLPYTLFKMGYEIAKLITRVLSNLRHLLFLPK